MPSFCHLQCKKWGSNKSWVWRPGNEASIVHGGGGAVVKSGDLDTKLVA